MGAKFKEVNTLSFHRQYRSQDRTGVEGSRRRSRHYRLQGKPGPSLPTGGWPMNMSSEPNGQDRRSSNAIVLGWTDIFAKQ